MGEAPMPRTQRAGEGGGLPKGLSLFRFILFSALMLGGVYGAASLYFNEPPVPGDIPPHGVPSAQWQPSPLWFPSYLAIELGIGVRSTADGYVFSGRMGHAYYAVSSLFIAMLMLGLVGWFGGEAIRKYAVRKRYE